MGIHKPKCPHCGGSEVRLVRSPSNILRVCASVIVGVILGEIVSIRWKCMQDGTVFRARGTEPVDSDAGPPVNAQSFSDS